MCGDFFTRTKICMAIAIGVMLLGRADARLVESAAERIGVDKDHTVEEIREAVSGAYEEAEAVMSQRLDGVFEAPYTSSGARAADDGIVLHEAAGGSASTGGAAENENVKDAAGSIDNGY